MKSAFTVLVVSLMLFADAGAAWAGQGASPNAARLRGSAAAPLAPPMTVGGGEVVLDVTVAANGSVAKVQPIRATPPYTELLVNAVGSWGFVPARAVTEGELQPAESHVLVVAVYRPPQVYAAPALGVETKTVGELAPELPAPAPLSMPPSYPPQATRDGAVVIELELSMAGVIGGAKVISRPSAFDSAALATVRSWRFDVPRNPKGAESIFVYAVVGFREPITGVR
jgi:TonB family protein